MRPRRSNGGPGRQSRHRRGRCCRRMRRGFCPVGLKSSYKLSFLEGLDLFGRIEEAMTWLGIIPIKLHVFGRDDMRGRHCDGRSRWRFRWSVAGGDLAEKYQLRAIGSRQIDEHAGTEQLGSAHHSIWRGVVAKVQAIVCVRKQAT